MKKILLLLLTGLSYLTISGQCASNITLFSQEEVDAFPQTYGCSVIEGNLSIGYFQSSTVTTIENVDSLYGLTEIYGDLVILNNSVLTNINGLENLSQVGGLLKIDNNPSLVNLDGLENLTTLQEDLQIFENPALTHISGLIGLTSIHWNLRIVGNASLVDLAGLDNLVSVGGFLRFEDNASLTNLQNIGNLQSLGSGLEIIQNPSLVSLEGFENINNILGEFLTIEDNDLLTDLTGLNNLISVDDNLHIIGNENLSSLAGLENLETISENLFIWSNPNLVDLSNLESLNSVGDLRIEHNASLVNLSGLENLTNLMVLRIWNNNLLSDLTELSNLTDVSSDLIVSGNDLLVSLSGLENLENVGNLLSISQNPMLTDLNGLESLNSVGENFVIEGNNSISTLSGLENLTSVEEDLEIRWNESLVNLNGLDNLSFLGSRLFIESNNSLVSLSGLEGLDEIGGQFYLQYNTSLPNLNGLNNVDFIGGQTLIWGNLALTSLEGLENVEEIQSSFWIYQNHALTNMVGLGNLTTVGDFFRIQENESLESLIDLASLETLEDDFEVTDNPVLAFCCPILNFIDGIEGNLILENNLPSCNSEEAIVDYCLNVAIPIISVSLNSLNFEEFAIGTTNTLYLEVQNVGDGELIVESLLFDNEAFSTNIESFSLSSQESLEIPIFFAPTDEIDYGANLTFVSNAGSLTISLSGSGIGPMPSDLVPNVETLDFEEVVIGTTDTLYIIIENPGGQDLSIQSLLFSNEAFTSSLESFTVASQSSIEIPIYFTPTDLIDYVESLTILSNVGTQNISLTGSGVNPPSPILTLNIDTINFNNAVIENEDYLPLSFMIENTGNADLEITGFSIDNPAFSVDLDDLVISAQDSGEILVSFQTEEAGIFEGTLILQTNAGEFTIPLNAVSLVAATGLGQISQTNIKVFPNPNEGQFYIESLTLPIQAITLHNSLGQIVVERQGHSPSLGQNLGLFQQIDVREQSKGLYFLTVRTEKGIFVKKILVR